MRRVLYHSVYLLFLIACSESNFMELTFDSLCGDHTFVDEPSEKIESESALSCSILCVQRTRDITQEYCSGFNYCGTLQKCYLLIGNSCDNILPNCSKAIRDTECRYYRMMNKWNPHDESTPVSLYSPSFCLDLGFQKVYETAGGNSSSGSGLTNLESLRNSVNLGEQISVVIENYEKDLDLLLQVNVIKINNGFEVCAQSIHNIQWEDDGRSFNQTFFVLCTTGDVIIQEVQLDTGIINSRREQRKLHWFRSKRATYKTYGYFFGNFNYLRQSVIDGYNVAVVWGNTSVQLTHMSWTNLQVVGQMPWAVEMTHNASIVSQSPYWNSYLFSSLGTTMLNVTKWSLSNKKFFSSFPRSGFPFWLVQRCWVTVLDVDKNGNVNKGSIRDLIYHINRGRRLRITTSVDVEEPVSLLVSRNKVWALTNSMMADNSHKYKIPLSRYVRLLSSEGKVIIHKVEIENNVHNQSVQSTNTTWVVDTSGWKEFYSTEDYMKRNSTAIEAFRSVFDTGATVRVRIPYGCMELYLTVDNIMCCSARSPVPMANAIQHVQLSVNGDDVALDSKPNSEFFRIYANGTVVLTSVEYNTNKFVYSATLHHASIKWYLNIN